jgi:hypothetical protein
MGSIKGDGLLERVVPAGTPTASPQGCKVWSCNEWDPLEEVVVGNPFNARFPHPDKSTQVAEYPDRSLEEIPCGPFPQKIIEEKRLSTIHWETEGYYNYCPRDIMLVIGNQIIETPNVIRGRSQETFSYRNLLLDYMRSGAKWISAPKPMLLDSLFDVDLTKPTPRNEEPAFDAANILRFGYDLIYLVSATGNELGSQWLQSILGDKFRSSVIRRVSARKTCLKSLNSGR